MLRFRSLAVSLGLVAVLALPLVADAAAPKASWSCVQGVCVGQSRELINYRYGQDWDRGLYRTLRVNGGDVRVYFYKEYVLDYVALDNVKDFKRVTGVSSCSPVVRLPDRVGVGTRIPFGKRWNGYTRVILGEPGPRTGWRKFVRVGKTKIRVTLDMDRSRVTCVSIARVFP